MAPGDYHPPAPARQHSKGSNLQVGGSSSAGSLLFATWCVGGLIAWASGHIATYLTVSFFVFLLAL